METVALLIGVIGVLLVIYSVRTHWMRRAAATAGLDFSVGPSAEQREAWRALTQHLHNLEPTSWGHTLRGVINGAALALQEQQLKTSVSANGEWHTLVIWTLPDAGLPIFKVFRASEGRPWIRALVAPLVDPAVRALGGDPGAAPPSMPVPIAQDAAFASRFCLVGPNPDALIAHFAAARRAALCALEVSGPVASDSQRLIWLRPGRAGPMSLTTVIREARALRRVYTAR